MRQGRGRYFEAVLFALSLAGVCLTQIEVASASEPVVVRVFQKDLNVTSASKLPGEKKETLPLRGLIATVDLGDPRVSVHVSQSPHVEPGKTVSLADLIPTDQWARDNKMTLAINASYFSWLSETKGAPIGLFVRHGQVITPGRLWQGRMDPGLVFLKSGGAKIIGPDQPEVPITDIAEAVAGVGGSFDELQRGTLVVQWGKNLGATARVSADERYARTGVGIDATGKKLFLFCIDGSQPGYSVGITLPELAEIMIAEGVVDGINLDGGGSTAMIYQPEPTGEIVKNQPSDERAGSVPGKFRPVPTHLGFRVSKEATKPVSATDDAFAAPPSAVQATPKPRRRKRAGISRRRQPRSSLDSTSFAMDRLLDADHSTRKQFNT